MTTSPRRTAAVTSGNSRSASTSPPPRMEPGSACDRWTMSGPAVNTRSIPQSVRGRARAACRATVSGPSSSMSPSTAIRLPPGPGRACPRTSMAASIETGDAFVALVDEPQAPLADGDRMAPAATLERPKIGKRRGGGGNIAAGRRHGGQDRQAVHHPMAAGNPDPKSRAFAGDRRHDAGALGLRDGLDEADDGVRMNAEGNYGVHPARRGGGGETAEMARVAIEHCDPVRLHAGEDLRLGVGDLLDVREEGAVHRGHPGDQRHVGAGEPGQGFDLPSMVHAHLEDPEAGVRGHAGETEGQAPVVVEAALICGRRPLAPEDQLQGFLCPGLADASGHRDYAGAGAGASRSAQPEKRRHRVP